MTNPIKTCPGCTDPVVRITLSFDQQCSPCRKKERHRLWRIANPNATAANAKRWRDAGNISVRPQEYEDEHRERERRRYHENPNTNAAAKARAVVQRERKGPELLAVEAREWRAQNPGKTRIYHERHIAKLSPGEKKAQGKAHRTRYRVQRQAGTAAYYARRYGGEGIISNEHLYALHKWQDHCCFYCRSGLKGAETIEHVVPLSRGGSNNPWNVTLACSDCNTKKNNRIFRIEWKPEHVNVALRFHSSEGTKVLSKRLSELNISHEQMLDHLMIGDRPVFVLSSFWLGWQGIDYIAALKQLHPTAIVFFDKEITRRPDAVVNVLKAKAGIAERIGARKLQLVEPSGEDARTFIGRWHAMGFAAGNHYIGLRDENEWWAIAAFRKELDRYEIIRMAIRETVAGGVSRIMKHFRERISEGLPIIAFTDQRMGDGKSHFFAGFEAEGMTERSFFYATPEADGFHPRRDFQKQVLEAKAEYFDPNRTQVENAMANGLMRVEGLPRLRFVLR